MSADAQYDLACACGTNDKDHRKRSWDDRWLYPVTLPNGGYSVLFKCLISNVCSNDCKYCPLRSNRDFRRCTLNAEETARAFQHYLKAGKVFGLFLSSGVVGTPDNTMEHLVSVARILRRREHYRGYIHLKIIPGASDAAVEEAVALASAVSLNIETPGEKHFARLSSRKNFLNDVIRPIKLISRLTAKGARYARVKQTTQFIVGASDETDREIVKYAAGIYDRLAMDRIYFSSYQRGLGENDVPGELSALTNREMLTREHRLYQVDFLLRKYGFTGDEIPFDASGNLSLEADPKESWVRLHPEEFPVDINRADKFQLLRVPEIGPTTARRILDMRAQGCRIRRLEDIGKSTSRLRRSIPYLKF